MFPSGRCWKRVKHPAPSGRSPLDPLCQRHPGIRRCAQRVLCPVPCTGDPGDVHSTTEVQPQWEGREPATTQGPLVSCAPPALPWPGTDTPSSFVCSECAVDRVRPSRRAGRGHVVNAGHRTTEQPEYLAASGRRRGPGSQQVCSRGRVPARARTPSLDQEGFWAAEPSSRAGSGAQSTGQRLRPGHFRSGGHCGVSSLRWTYRFSSSFRKHQSREK